MDFSRTLLHGLTSYMFARALMKTAAGKTSRSGCHHFIIAPLPFERARRNHFDIVGGVVVAGLFASALVLMRMLLAN
jgi:hypothetical protein